MITLNGHDQKKVANAIEELVNSMVRIKSEQDLIKDICSDIKEKYEILPSALKKTANFKLDTEKKTKLEEEVDVIDYLTNLKV